MSEDSRITRRSISVCIRCTYAAFLLVAMAGPQVGQAEPVPLHFDTFAPETNVTNMNNELGPGYTGGLTMDFLSVAAYEGMTIDARVTAEVRPNTQFATGATNRTARGYIPNYKAITSDQPKGDLGFLYAAVDGGAPGIALTISFFNGTGDRRGRFSETCIVPDLRLLVYDVDGEPAQAEWFDASYADGLYSYATGSAAASVTATPTAAGVHFVGPGKDFKETDTSGAVLLQYRNTSQITLAFGANQHEGGMNPVFSAIDGDVSLPVTGSFQTPKPAAPPVRPSAPRAISAQNAIRIDRLTPAEVQLNVPFDYTLKITNVAETPLQDVVVLERLPSNFSLQSSDPETEKVDGNLRWTIGSLDPKASRELKVSGVATSADNIKPCATVTFAAPPLCADIAVLEPKLTLTATAPKEALVCDPIELQFVVTNDGTGVAENVQIVGALPAGLRTTEDKAELALNVGALAPGQSRQFRGSVKAAGAGEYVTTVVASGNGGLTAEATTTTTVRRPVLTITKTGPARQHIGQPITYEITVTNTGDALAANTTVEDTVPQGGQGLQTSPDGAVTGSKVVWQLGAMAAGASRKVSITYAPTMTGSLAQAATAAAACADRATVTAETEVFGIAAVLLEVVDTDDPVLVGGRTTYTITATNQGSSPSTNVQITVAVEDAEEIVEATGPAPVAINGSTATSAPLATLAPKAKATWQITVKALKPGDVRFRAALTTAELGRIVEETEATQLYE